MAYNYPPAAPSLSGDIVSINRFLNSPTLIERRLNDIVAQRFIADVILSGRSQAPGGAVVYELDEGLFSDSTVEGVAPGADYPVATLSGGSAQLAKIVKWGQDTLVTDEAISRQRLSAVERGLQKLANAVVKQVDSVSLSLISSVVTATSAASAVWSGPSATILRDVMKAKASVIALNKGYDPDTLVVDDLTWALVASDPTVISALRREDASNTVYTGEFPIIAGLRVLPTPNLPVGGALVCDSMMLGGIATEDLGGGYQGGNVEVKTIREDANDRWRLRARRPCVPYITDTGAGVFITGISS